MVNVRFGDVVDHADIDIETVDNSTFTVNIGFLQDHHIYGIHIMLPIEVKATTEIFHEGNLPIIESNVLKDGDGCEIALSVRLDGVHGHLQSILTVDATKIAVRASVLKCHDGTPSLKRGVSIKSKIEHPEKTAQSAKE